MIPTGNMGGIVVPRSSAEADILRAWLADSVGRSPRALANIRARLSAFDAGVRGRMISADLAGNAYVREADLPLVQASGSGGRAGGVGLLVVAGALVVAGVVVSRLGRRSK